MSGSRKYRRQGPAERRKAFTSGPPPRLMSAWKRAECCGALIAAAPARMGKDWADVHEPGCPVPWEILGLPGRPRQVYPGAPYLPPGARLRAVNRKPGRIPARLSHLAPIRGRSL